jgi:hypothetical protein
MKDTVRSYDACFIISVDPKTMDEKEYRNLTKEADEVIK